MFFLGGINFHARPFFLFPRRLFYMLCWLAWYRTVTKGMSHLWPTQKMTCLVQAALVLHHWHFIHTQSKLMGLYMKRGARCGGAQVRPGSPTAAAMSDATSSTMLVSHHRYFIAHSLVSLFFLSTSDGLHQIHMQHNFFEQGFLIFEHSSSTFPGFWGVSVF